MSAIEEAIQAAGFARSIVIDDDGAILAGNGATEAAGNVGVERAVIVDAPADAIVAVRRRGLTPAQKRILAIADNRAHELSSFDGPLLRAALAELTDDDADALAALGFRRDDLERLAPSEPNRIERGPARCPRCRKPIS